MAKKLRKRFYLYLVLTIMTMGMIFIFSSQDADQSSQVSGSVLDWIITHTQTFLPGGVMSFLMHYIRKVAHFMVYFMLGIFAFLGVREWIRSTEKPIPKEPSPKERGSMLRRIQSIGIPWLIAVIYAITDEFHQSFVPGRACQFRDVCIDSAGAACGIMIIWLILHLLKKDNKQ